MNREAANLTRMSIIVSLDLIVDVVEHNDGSYEEDYLTGGQKVQIVSAILSTVAISVAVMVVSRGEGREREEQLPIDRLLIEQTAEKKTKQQVAAIDTHLHPFQFQTLCRWASHIFDRIRLQEVSGNIDDDRSVVEHESNDAFHCKEQDIQWQC